MLVLSSDAVKGGPAPWVTWALIGINVLAFGAQQATGDAITNGFSLVPREFTTGEDLVVPQRVWLHVWVPGPDGGGHFEEQDVNVPQCPGPFPIQLTLFTHMFLHGGWGHLIGNMWFLFIFGGQVERSLQPGKFLAGYVLCGLAAGLAQVAIGPRSLLPCLGASGAISGVMGAYLFVHPFSMIRVWMGVWAVRLPGSLVLGLWFIAQVLSTIAAAAGEHTGVASAAHAGGFVAGLVFICVLMVWDGSRSAPAVETRAPALNVAPIRPLREDIVPGSLGARAVIGERGYLKAPLITFAILFLVISLAGIVLGVRDLYAAKGLPGHDPKPRETPSNAQAPPERAVERARAMIRIRVPLDAHLWLGGEKCKQTGRLRSCQTVPLEVSKDYEFVLRARWLDGDRVADQTRRVIVRAGDKAEVDFTRPEPPGTPRDDEGRSGDMGR